MIKSIRSFPTPARMRALFLAEGQIYTMNWKRGDAIVVLEWSNVSKILRLSEPTQIAYTELVETTHARLCGGTSPLDL